MTQAPKPGPLTSESVKLLVKGDLLRVICDTLIGESGIRIPKGTVVEFEASEHGLVGVQGDFWGHHAFAFIGRPDESGWMLWSGGKNPVPGQRVEARCRDGIVKRDLSGIFAWSHSSSHDDRHSDIIAFRLAPPAPVEASGSERDLQGETFMGFRVAAWRYRQADETDKLPHHYAEHWSTPGASAWGIQRLFTEDQLQQALNLRPQPSGETREAVARELIRQHYGDRGYSELGIANIIEGEVDGWLSKADAILALLSARPLALGGQQGEDFTSVHGLWKDQSLSRLERVRAHRFEFGSELKAALEAVDDEAARQSLANKTTAPLLARAREYVVDSLDAHEHSDGRDLLNEIDATLSTTPARAEAQDEGAAGEIKPCPFCGTKAVIGRSQRAITVGCDFNDCPSRECYSAGRLEDETAVIAAWNARAHPSPTPAADADRVREAIADVISHESDWRTALTAMDAAEETPEDGSGKPGYWLHQIKVLDRILAALKSEWK